MGTVHCTMNVLICFFTVCIDFNHPVHLKFNEGLLEGWIYGLG